MENENLNSELEYILIDVLENSTKEEKKAFHLKSAGNLGYSLINSNPKDFQSKLINININRYKRSLLDYLTRFKNNELDVELSNQYFKEDIQEIGYFMSEHFNFSYFAGDIVIFIFLLRLIPGVILDLIIYFFFDLNSSGLFSLFFLGFNVLKFLKKKKLGKIYGPGF